MTTENNHFMINMSHDPSLYRDDDDHIHDREGEMRFYDFKRRLGDKGSEVRMVIIVIFIVSIMVFNIITSTMFGGEDDDDAVLDDNDDLCKAKCRRKSCLTKVPAENDSAAAPLLTLALLTLY